MLSTIKNYLFIFFSSKLPGRKGTGPGGWLIQAKLQVYFWLGSIKHKKSYPSGLPPGFQVTNELLNAERPGLPPPTSIHYAEKHVSFIFTLYHKNFISNIISFRFAIKWKNNILTFLLNICKIAFSEFLTRILHKTFE